MEKDIDQLDGVERVPATGFKGRVAVYEILVMDEDIRKMLLPEIFRRFH